MATSFINDFSLLSRGMLAAVSVFFAAIMPESSFAVTADGSAGKVSAETSQGPSAAAKSDDDVLFQTKLVDFSAPTYNAAVSALFRAYEKYCGKKIKRGPKGKVGLKIYTNSGPGLSTPKNLIDAVIAQLERRGYKKGDITIVDMSARKMRSCGFLPKLSQVQAGASDTYGGINVADIESGKFFDKRWYYDNALTPKNIKTSVSFREIYDPEIRKSYLPVPLFLTVDFWINLPVITDMEGLGVCAAIGNASIWNMSNNERFLKEPANASMAAAEVCAIPELKESNLFTIISYENGQFVGGSVYNARFSFSENGLYLSANPVVIDYMAWLTINKYRRANRFKGIDDEPPVLGYCRQLGIGACDYRKIKRINVPYKLQR